MLSEKYGWTPEQIRNQRFDDIANYIDIVEMKKWLRKHEAKKNNK